MYFEIIEKIENVRIVTEFSQRNGVDRESRALYVKFLGSNLGCSSAREVRQQIPQASGYG